MEQPRACPPLVLLEDKYEDEVSLCGCADEKYFICVSVGRTPGILERLLLTDLMPVLDMRHVADTLPQANAGSVFMYEHVLMCVRAPVCALWEPLLISPPDVSFLCSDEFYHHRVSSRCSHTD